MSPLSINKSYSQHQLLIQSFLISPFLSPFVCFVTSHNWPCIDQMRMLDLQVGSKSISNALWLSVSWHLCACLSISVSQPFLILLWLTFLLSLTKPLQQCWCSQPASTLRGRRCHTGAFVRVNVCAGIHGCVWHSGKIVLAKEQSEHPQSPAFWAVAVSEVFSVSSKKKDGGKQGIVLALGHPAFLLTSALWASGLERGSACGGC